MNNRHIELKAENERLRALLAKTEEAIIPLRQGKRDGGSFGWLSRASDEIRAALAATKDAVPTCVKCGEIEGAHDEQEVVQVGHEFIAPKK